MSKQLIYFICTGNSCRSQMAEGFARKLGGSRVDVKSAGVEAHGLNPKAVQVMQEAGVDISNHTSDEIDPEVLQKCDYVITLCGDANDKCPLTPAEVKREHWDLSDPARAVGTDQEIRNTFRQVRDEIQARVKDLLKRI